MYFLEIEMNLLPSADGNHLIAGIATFLMVFRLNQCYHRQQEGKDLLTDMMTALQELAVLTCTSLMGSGRHYERVGEHVDGDARDFHKAAVAVKVHTIRLIVAFAVAIKYHTRISFWLGLGHIDPEVAVHALLDLDRIKTLLTEEEEKLVNDRCGLYEDEEHKLKPPSCCSCSPVQRQFVADVSCYRPGTQRGYHVNVFDENMGRHGGSALPPVLLQLLRMATIQPLNKGWGYPERLLNVHESLFKEISKTFERIDTLVQMPLPIPYLQLCKILLLMFIMTYPLSMDLSDGIWGNVFIPCLLSMGLCGIELVADMLQNPFGDNTTDLNLLETIHSLEMRCQTIFDLSEAHGRDITSSWTGLEERLNIAQTSKRSSEKLLSGTDGTDSLTPYGFMQFFNWHPLPAQTVKYVIERSYNDRDIYFASTFSEKKLLKLLTAVSSEEATPTLARDIESMPTPASTGDDVSLLSAPNTFSASELALADKLQTLYMPTYCLALRAANEVTLAASRTSVDADMDTVLHTNSQKRAKRAATHDALLTRSAASAPHLNQKQSQ
eukprot:TRINITY_DN7043_c0_g1_i1.p1 TRINITY_DN7043_c0_g1~~TRINITY_DN7043_c0_g1_i1.p1  ORF type:complete len:553 (+),score=117.82 TRINITY_DN7043_c0_g1_i1:181-1839(+)